MKPGQVVECESPRDVNTGTRAAAEFYRRKLDKIPTEKLRSGIPGMGYYQIDHVSGERFYLTVEECKLEVARREALAEKIALEFYEVYRQRVGGLAFNKQPIPEWAKLEEWGTPRLGWIAVAEAVMEKYRCLL